MKPQSLILLGLVGFPPLSFLVTSNFFYNLYQLSVIFTVQHWSVNQIIMGNK